MTWLLSASLLFSADAAVVPPMHTVPLEMEHWTALIDPLDKRLAPVWESEQTDAMLLDDLIKVTWPALDSNPSHPRNFKTRH